MSRQWYETTLQEFRPAEFPEQRGELDPPTVPFRPVSWEEERHMPVWLIATIVVVTATIFASFVVDLTNTPAAIPPVYRIGN